MRLLFDIPRYFPRLLHLLLLSRVSTVELAATDVDDADQININTASAEELMTLAGVSRSLAENLIRHRRKIGGFKYLEDVAIVNGFGAAKLNAIKHEIKIGSGDNSINSSPKMQV